MTKGDIFNKEKNWKVNNFSGTKFYFLDVVDKGEALNVKKGE